MDGAKSQGAETDLLHLYDLTYPGCKSCFSCKMKEGKRHGRCAVQDGLTLVLNMIPEIDALILMAPLYFGLVTGMMRCFLGRLLFVHLASTNPPLSLYPRKIPTACIDTMNISEPQTNEFYRGHIDAHEAVLPGMFGHAESLFSNETLQFEEYNRMDSSCFEPEVSKERYRAVFPEDCRRAHELGSWLKGK